MATYSELYDLRSNDTLKNKVSVAVAIKAQALLDAAMPTAAQVAWANDAITDPVSKAGQLLNYVLAANSSATVAQITGASDSSIQNNVNSAADALIAGGV